MVSRIFVAIGFSFVLAACQTTQQVDQAVRNSWIGQPSEAFFSMHGMPVSKESLDASGTAYVWRGGTTGLMRPPSLAFGSAPSQRGSFPAMASRVSQIEAMQGFYSLPPQWVELTCEVELIADVYGNIRTLRISRDTEGEFFSFSRCAEVFGV